MEAVARLTNFPMSARKMRLVMDNIRGKDVKTAMNILRFSKQEASFVLEKVLRSAVANWAVKNEVELADAAEENLFVKTIFADGGTMLKRFQPAPQGRAHRILKRTNHITVVVDVQ
jgi:large subunit ribosomal protein L22